MYNLPEYKSVINVARTYLREIADPAFNMKQPGIKELGSGAHGETVLGKDKDSTIKRPLEGDDQGRIGKHEMKAMERLDGMPGFPRLLQKDVTPNKDGSFSGKIAMGLAKGKPMSDVSLDADQKQDAFRKIMRLRRDMHKKGVAHNDMHQENIFIDDDNNPSVIDFGEAHVDSLAALGEALGFTNPEMPSDFAFDGAMDMMGEDGVEMRDSKMMDLLKKNHGSIIEKIKSMGGGKQIDKFMNIPAGRPKIQDFDAIRKEVPFLQNEDNVYDLINRYYEGIEDNAPATRMNRAVGDLRNIKDRIGRGGNLRTGERLVPDRNLDD